MRRLHLARSWVSSMDNSLSDKSFLVLSNHLRFGLPSCKERMMHVNVIVITVCSLSGMRKICLIFLSTIVTVFYIFYIGSTLLIRRSSTVLIIPKAQSTRRQSYRFPVGVTELKQCQRALKLFPGKVTDKPIYGEFNYCVSVISVDADTGILLHVRETRKKKPTGGGSSLLALSDSVRRRLCFYDDYFNGTYIIWCPPPSPGQCSKVSVEIKFVNFSAYIIGYFPLNYGVIWERKICWNEASTKQTYQGVDLPRTLTPPWSTTNPQAPHTCRIDWIRGANGSVINDNGVEIPLLEDDEFCLRIRRFRRIIMIGSSHMRYKFNYISLKCMHSFGPKKRKHGSAKVDGMIYKGVLNMISMADFWTKHLGNMNLTKHDAVIIQHGAHDMYATPFRKAVSIFLHKYVSYMEVIKRHSVRLGFRLIAVTTPPFPDVGKRHVTEQRNSFTLAALARLVHVKLSAARIDIFDEFAVLLPYYNNDAHPCGGHYLCPDRKHDAMLGHTGIVALHLLVRHLAGEADSTMC